MLFYMDLHIVPGISAKMAAEAHKEDHKIQDEFGCRCMTYWVDEQRSRPFCSDKFKSIYAHRGYN